MFSRGERIAAIAVVAIAVAAIIWYFHDRNAQQEDFRGDVVAMEFAVMGDADWDDEEDGSTLEIRVNVDDCWVIELSRAEDEDNILTTINGRAIETLRFDEIHLDPSPEIENTEPDVHDFTGELTPENVKKYMQARKDTYPCRKKFALAG